MNELDCYYDDGGGVGVPYKVRFAYVSKTIGIGHTIIINYNMLIRLVNRTGPHIAVETRRFRNYRNSQQQMGRAAQSG